MGRLAVLLFFSFSAFSDEPGHFHIDLPPPQPAPAQPEPPPPPPAPAPAQSPVARDRRAVMAREFARAAGLSAAQAFSLDIQRVACGGRVFTPSGRSLEGDADLKVLHSAANLFEMEFPSHVYLTRESPYKNGIEYLETEHGRQLFSLQDWRNEEVLRIRKAIVLQYIDDRDNETVTAVDEFKVLPDSYPPTFIVRETVLSKRKFVYYWLCQ